MIECLLPCAIALSALGSGLTAGVFFAFSNFIMKGLAALPGAQGANAMNAIGITVINPLFMSILFGTAVSTAGTAVLALAGENDAGLPWLVAASIIYFAGVVVVTMACNVPLNNALAAAEHREEADLAAVWRRYVRRLTTWNHVRTIAALLACACLVRAR